MPRLSDGGTCYVHPIQNEFDWMVWENVLKKDGYELEINSMENEPCWYAAHPMNGWVPGGQSFQKEWTCWEDAHQQEWYVRAVKPKALLDNEPEVS